MNDQLIDVQNQLKETLTGTSFDSLLDGVYSLFTNATTSAEDFGNNFQKIMQDAIGNSFKREYLAKQLQGFYDNLAAFVQKDGTPTQADIAALQSQYNDIINNANNYFKTIEATTGITFGDNGSSSSNTLSGGVKGITTDQADLIAGQFGGLRLTQLQTNNILTDVNGNMRAQLAEVKQQSYYQMQIAANTKRTADNTDSLPGTLTDIKSTLQSIDKKVSSNSNALAANGRLP